MNILYLDKPYIAGYHDKAHDNGIALFAEATFYFLTDAEAFAKDRAESRQGQYHVYQDGKRVVSFENGKRF